MKTNSSATAVFWPSDFDGSSGKEFAGIFDAPPCLWDEDHINLFLGEYRNLKQDNQALKMENQRLHQELQVVHTNQANAESVPEVRDVSRSKAKKEVAKFFVDYDGEVIYPSDVGEALNLSYLLVNEIIGELESEGKIRRASK